MIIECLVRREGPTTIVLGQTKYLFTPVPGSKKGEPSTSICDISAEEHVKYLLDEKRYRQFREYDPEQTAKEIEATRLQGSIYSGFSIFKYRDSGYIVLDQRKKNSPKYAGMDGRWMDDAVNLSPFPTEFQAFQWLKEEVEFADSEPQEPKEKEPKEKAKTKA